MNKQEKIEFKILEMNAQIVFYTSKQAMINKTREKLGQKPKDFSHIQELIFATKREKKFWENELERPAREKREKAEQAYKAEIDFKKLMNQQGEK